LACVVRFGIIIESTPWRPILKKCSHLRDKRGVLTLRTPIEFALTPTSSNCHHVKGACTYGARARSQVYVRAVHAPAATLKKIYILITHTAQCIECAPRRHVKRSRPSSLMMSAVLQRIGPHGRVLPSPCPQDPTAVLE
jgi:hypothetical protein